MKIILKNFKGITERAITPGHIEEMIGKNGAGKSSTIEAIKFAITGVAPDDAIKADCDKASVSVELDGFQIERKLSRTEKGMNQTVKLNGQASTQKKVEEFLKEKYGENSLDVYKFVFNPSLIEKMEVNELTGLILKVVPSQVKMDDILSQIDLDADAKMLISANLPDMAGLDDIASFCEKYETVLKDTKASIKALEGFIGQKPEKPAMSYEDAEAALAQIAEMEAGKIAYEKAVKDYQTVIAKNNEITDKINTLMAEIPADIKEPDRQMIDAVRRSIEETQNAIRSNVSSSAVISNSIAVNRQMLDRLSSSRCPLSDKIECHTDKSGLKAEISIVIENGEKELERLAAEKNALEIKLEDLQAKNDSFNREIISHNNVLQKRQTIEILKKSYLPVPEMPVKPFYEELDGNEQVMVRKAELQNIKSVWLTIKKMDEQNSELENLRQRKAVLETVVKTTKEKGVVREKIMDTAMTPINELLNQTAHKFNPDFDIRFSNDGGIRIRCKTGKDKPELSISSLSEGEQTMFAYFVIDMICSIMDCKKVLVMDNLNRLDAENYQAVIRMLEQSDFEHIFTARC